MGKFIVIMLSFYCLACNRSQDDPCADRSSTPVPYPYQVVSSINDTLYITYTACDTCWLEGCTLRGATTRGDTAFTRTGTYNLSGKGMLKGSYINVSGFAEKKGWTLKIISSSGSEIETSDAQPYSYLLSPNGDTIWTKKIFATLK